MSPTDEPSDDDLEAAFAREAPFVDRGPRARAKREQAMRSPYSEKHHPRHKGDRVQFNRKMRRALHTQVAAACKRHNINETDALEQAFTLWLAQMGKRNA
jgi:hypothetical protein